MITVSTESAMSGWQPIGTDASRGINVDMSTLSWSHDVDGGPRSCSFVVRRPTNIHDWSDLQLGAGVYVESKGMPAWSGRISKTAVIDGGIQVECEGWFAHLQDDPQRLFFAHSFIPAWEYVETGCGGIFASVFDSVLQCSNLGYLQLKLPQNSAVTTAEKSGFVLDLGEGNRAEELYLSYTSANNTTANYIYAAGTDDPNLAYSSWEKVAVYSGTGASGTATVSFDKPYRYLFIYYYRNGSSGNSSVNWWFRISKIFAVANAAYQAAGVSALNINDIATTVAGACPRISEDLSAITDTGINFIHWPAELTSQTPRDYLRAAADLNLFQTMTSPERLPRLIVRPEPTDPRWIVPSHAATLALANTNDLSGLYTRLEVRWQDGTNAARTDIYTPSTDDDVDATNPGFEGNVTTGWTISASKGTMSVISSTPYLGTYAGRMTGNATSAAAANAAVKCTSFSGTWIPGMTYTATMQFRKGSAVANHAMLIYAYADGVQIASGQVRISSDWAKGTVQFTIPTNFAGDFYLLFSSAVAHTAAQVVFDLDDLRITTDYPRPLSTFGYRRTAVLEVQTPSTQADIDTLGQGWIDKYIKPSWAGSVQIVGTIQSTDGSRVPVSQITAGDRVEFPDLVNPSTGNNTRTGIITSVEYAADTDTASLTIDEGKSYFDYLQMAATKKGLL